MVNNVNGVNSRQTSGPQKSGNTGVERPRDTTSSGSAPTAGGDVFVELSQSAQVEAAAKRLASESAVDSNRVEQLREQLRNGDYQLDPQLIAQKLVSFDNGSQ